MFEYEIYLSESKRHLSGQIKKLIYEYEANFDIPISTKDADVYIVKFESEVALDNFKNELDNLFLG